MKDTAMDCFDPELYKQYRGKLPASQLFAGCSLLEPWECGCRLIYFASPADRCYRKREVCDHCRRRIKRSRGEVAVYAEIIRFFPDAVLGQVMHDHTWDITIPRLNVVIEFDGAGYHSDDDQTECDKRHGRRIMAAGWIIIRLRERPLPSLEQPGVQEIFFSSGKNSEFSVRMHALTCDLVRHLLTAEIVPLVDLVELESRLEIYTATGKMQAWGDFRQHARCVGMLLRHQSLGFLYPDKAEFVIGVDPFKVSPRCEKPTALLCPGCRLPWHSTPMALTDDRCCKACGAKKAGITRKCRRVLQK